MHALPWRCLLFVSAQLHGNLSDPLYHTLVEYSANTITHFDHTHIRRGICPKKTCARHMHTSTNLTEVVEACLNESLTRDYSLTAKIFEAYCEDYSKESKLDSGDYTFAVVILVLLGLNLLGSFYDFFCENGKNKLVGKCLLCFSVRRNWQRLAAPGSASPMQRRIKSIHSFRTITALLVILGHSPIPSILVGADPQFMEETYHNILFHMLYNGTLIVQTFFMISGFLMAYNMLLSEQKRPLSWLNLPKGVLLRWLRLTPPYALVMFFVMTWMRHLSVGPFYLKSVTSEAVACHRDWWQHLLYIHNYIDHSQCMAHAWYLGAEFQLSILGLSVFCVLHSNRVRKMAIGAVVVVGLITPAVYTYVHDLHAILIVSPEVALNFFVEDPTFNNLYKRGHTNLICYGLGLAMAYAVYNLKDSDLGSKRYKAYLPLYWSLFPLMLVIVLTGYVFYIDGIIIPIGVRVVYSSAIKFIFGFATAVFIYLTIVKVDRAFRGFLNWGGWARISRLTYFAYLVHIPILRFGTGNVGVLVPFGVFWILTNSLSCICMAYGLAVPLFIMVESPLAELVKVTLVPQARPAALEVKASKETVEIKL
ncbi:nose resistant to fluoxetine protein 6-like isoform X2 [Cydia strobilella]|uniref:nose resistant to fluoxetine protein 6-like isoform X2 n=1 Tax=Cydia strobilella TaxID=1100964 RepID=UPI0030072545